MRIHLSILFGIAIDIAVVGGENSIQRHLTCDTTDKLVIYF